MKLTGLLLFASFIAILATIVRLIIPNGSQGLQNKFAELGNVRGKTLEEIIAGAGNYSLIESNPEGKAYIWSQPTYAIKLWFDANNICTKVLGEVVRNERVRKSSFNYLNEGDVVF